MRRSHDTLVAVGLAAATLLTLGRSALHDEKPAGPKITFESNDQAQYRLKDLAHVYGRVEKISSYEKHDINAAVEGAIPSIKSNVAQQARQMAATIPAGKMGRFVEGTNASGNKQSISVETHTDDKTGNKITRITSSVSTGRSGYKIRSSRVEEAPSGSIEIQFTNEDYYGPNGGTLNKRTVLNISPDDNAPRFDVGITSDFKNEKTYGSPALISFRHGHFARTDPTLGGYNTQGALGVATDTFSAMNAMLLDAAAALSPSAQG